MKKAILRILFALAVSMAAFAQTKTISPVVRQQFFDSTGAVVAGGKLCSFTAGTTTPVATYTDSTGGTPNSNPITLDSGGSIPAGTGIWLTPGTQYKFILYSSVGADNNCPNAGSQLWSVDNINGPSGPVVLSPAADQTITANNLLPNASNTTQSLGSTSAPWNGVFYQFNACSDNVILMVGSGAGCYTTLAQALSALP